MFSHDRMERTPNTVDAHRLILLAGQQGKQDVIVEGLFAAYFNEGRDVGDPAVLADVGAAAGLDRARILAMIASDEGLAEVRSELQRAMNLHVSCVPTVLVVAWTERRRPVSGSSAEHGAHADPPRPDG